MWRNISGKQLTLDRDPTHAREMLERLITAPLMKRVWDELYRRKRNSERGTILRPGLLDPRHGCSSLS